MGKKKSKSQHNKKIKNRRFTKKKIGGAASLSALSAEEPPAQQTNTTSSPPLRGITWFPRFTPNPKPGQNILEQEPIDEKLVDKIMAERRPNRTNKNGMPVEGGPITRSKARELARLKLLVKKQKENANSRYANARMRNANARSEQRKRRMEEIEKRLKEKSIDRYRRSYNGRAILEGLPLSSDREERLFTNIGAPTNNKEREIRLANDRMRQQRQMVVQRQQFVNTARNQHELFGHKGNFVPPTNQQIVNYNPNTNTNNQVAQFSPEAMAILNAIRNEQQEMQNKLNAILEQGNIIQNAIGNLSEDVRNGFNDVKEGLMDIKDLVKNGITQCLPWPKSGKWEFCLTFLIRLLSKLLYNTIKLWIILGNVLSLGAYHLGTVVPFVGKFLGGLMYICLLIFYIHVTWEAGVEQSADYIWSGVEYTEDIAHSVVNLMIGWMGSRISLPVENFLNKYHVSHYIRSIVPNDFGPHLIVHCIEDRFLDVINIFINAFDRFGPICSDIMNKYKSERTKKVIENVVDFFEKRAAKAAAEASEQAAKAAAKAAEEAARKSAEAAAAAAKAAADEAAKAGQKGVKFAANAAIGLVDRVSGVGESIGRGIADGSFGMNKDVVFSNNFYGGGKGKSRGQKSRKKQKKSKEKNKTQRQKIRQRRKNKKLQEEVTPIVYTLTQKVCTLMIDINYLGMAIFYIATDLNREQKKDLVKDLTSISISGLLTNKEKEIINEHSQHFPLGTQVVNYILSS